MIVVIVCDVLWCGGRSLYVLVVETFSSKQKETHFHNRYGATRMTDDRETLTVFYLINYSNDHSMWQRFHLSDI